MSLRGGALVPFDSEVERVSFTVKPLKIFSLAQKRNSQYLWPVWPQLDGFSKMC
jgi:hypothetical protein